MKRSLVSVALLPNLVAATLVMSVLAPARAAEQAEIECITPDGRVVEVAATRDDASGRPTMADDTLSCALQQGHTTFVIKLASAALLDRFSFVNENAAAGELKISVANDQLPATSDKWLPVDGRIGFANKRQVKVSLVGVDARYVKLDFTVTDANQTAQQTLTAGAMLVSQR